MTGVIPFGAVMGTVSADAGLTLFQSTLMNILAFAGASQLAAVDLMTKGAPILVIVITGWIINLRFLLYSAAFSPVVKDSGFLTKLLSAYLLTDQSYSVMTANEDKLPGKKEALEFYFGSCLCMAIFWHASVMVGFLFGNFAPKVLALEFAVPLSFIALVLPTLKSRAHIAVALFSSCVALLLYSLPMNSGLIVTAALSMTVAALITRQRAKL